MQPVDIQIKTTDDIKNLGTILGIWAHPDDETYTMGGLMAAAVKNGQTVACITATRGEVGVQNENRWPSRQLGAIRTQELFEAFNILGVREHHWLDFPDGDCKNVSTNQAVQRLISLIKTYNPDTIITFGPDGMTGHSDHQTVSHWTTLAKNQSGSRAVIYHAIQTEDQYQALQAADKAHDIYFNIEKPRTCKAGDCDIYFSLSDAIYEQKLTALRAMPSQTEAILDQFGLDLRPGIGIEAFVEADS